MSGGSSRKLPSYALLNAAVSYAFEHSLQGLQIGVSAFNLTDHRHFEILPSNAGESTGQHGEVIRRRLSVSATYRY